MDAKKKQHYGYLDVITRAAKSKVKGANIGLREDVVQEAFIKVVRSDFFLQHDITAAENAKVIASYIYRAVESCLYDELQKQGRLRRATQTEKELGGKGYISIESDEIRDDDFFSSNTPEHAALAQQVYMHLKRCFESCCEKIASIERINFFEAAFWEIEKYAMNLKVLALELGYKSANPTQELNRFIEKINLCVQPHGILVSGLEDIRFVYEMAEEMGG